MLKTLIPIVTVISAVAFGTIAPIAVAGPIFVPGKSHNSSDDFPYNMYCLPVPGVEGLLNCKRITDKEANRLRFGYGSEPIFSCHSAVGREIITTTCSGVGKGPSITSERFNNPHPRDRFKR